MPFRPRSLLLTLAAVTACGDGGADAPDADVAAPDAAADVDAIAPDAAPPVPVTVRAHDGATGVAGLPVAFLAADDTVVAVTTTDADGLATAIVPDGGQVVLASDDRRSAWLWLGVEGGETLEVFFDVTDTMTVVLPEGPADNGYYTVSSRCGGGGGGTATVTLSYLRRGCTADDLVASWSNGTQRVAFHAAGQALTAGTTLDLSARTWTPHVTRSMTFTGVVAADQTLVDFDLEISPGAVVDGPADNVGTASGDVALSGLIADLPGSRLRTTIGQIRGNRAFAVTHLGPVTDTSFAPGPFWLREVGDGTFDASARTATWTAGATGAVEDGVEVWLGVDRPAKEDPDVAWSIVAPSTTSVRIPSLPPELAPLEPTGGTAAYLVVHAHALPGGASALRTRIFGQLGWELLREPGTAAMATNRPYL